MQLLLNTIMLEVNRWTADHPLTRPLVDLLEPVKRAGFDALEIWQYHISALSAAELDALKDRLDALAMRAVALGAYPLFHLQDGEATRMAAELNRLVDCAATLGATTFKIFPGRVASADADPATRSLSVQRLKELADRLADRDMQLTMETHGNTLCDTEESTQRLLDELGDRPHVGLCFQPYTDQDTDAAIAMFDRLRPSVDHVHLQNRRQSDREATLLKEGDWTDYSRFLPHVRDSGFDALLCLEFTAGLFPSAGREFDPQAVIDNAVQDRDFVLEAWNRS